MRILAFSDLHRDRRGAARLVEMAREADIVVGAGDFASFRLGLNRTIDALRAIAAPTLLVHGNNETHTQLWRACGGWPNAIVLHGTGRTIDDVPFYGLGGAVPPTPFPWSVDLTEEEASRKLSDCPADAVLVVHSPPQGHVDMAFGRHLGSEAIRHAIESKRPRLVLCGHIHQCAGQQEQAGPTRIHNAGPDGVFVDL